jgi:hypothetical protein
LESCPEKDLVLQLRIAATFVMGMRCCGLVFSSPD